MKIREMGDLTLFSALVDGLWVEVPTYLNAKRLLAQPQAGFG